MADAFFGAPKTSYLCGSVEELQSELRNLIESKTTPTRAEHMSVTFELRATVIFYLTVPDAENDASESPDDLDAALGGAASSHLNRSVHGGLAARTVNANETLLNQPQNDSVLQTAVARHIIGLVGQVDLSSWAVRSVSRAAQGWTFTYACKDSMQTWNRQNAKNSGRTVVGESSLEDQLDQLNLSRPAFDCRGAITVVFNKASKCITVKYEHSPLHKTVGQLMEFFAPAPAAPHPAKQGKSKVPKAPKEPRTPKAPKIPNAPKRTKRQTDDTPEGGGSQKRRRTKKSEARPAPGPIMLPPDIPETASNPADSSQRQLYNTSAAHETSGPQGLNSYPQGLVEGDAAAAAQSAAAVPASVHAHSVLNLPPGEAARRREVAIELLTAASIDPQTLSAEQFNIFANQSPDLQKESLSMLMKYGAERLRIVHPSNKDKGANPASSSASGDLSQQTSAGAQPPAVATAGDSASESPGANPRAEQPKGTESSGTVNPVKQGLLRKHQTRGACEACKTGKKKCTKERPSCNECTNDGISCYYPPPKLRRKSAKAVDVEEDAGEGDETGELQEDPSAPEGTVDHTANSASNPNDPVANPQPKPDYFQTSQEGLTYHQPLMQVEPQQNSSSGPSLNHTQTRDFQQRQQGEEEEEEEEEGQQPTPRPTLPQQTDQIPAATNLDIMDRTNRPVSRSRKSRASILNPRHSLPPAQSTQSEVNTAVASGMCAENASRWQALNTPAAPVDTSHNVSPIMVTEQPSERSRKSAQQRQSSDVHQTFDGLQHAAALSQAAIQHDVTKPSPVTDNLYSAPVTNTRVKSRQGHRQQTRTPVQDVRPAQVSPAAPSAVQSHSYTGTSVTKSTTIPSYDHYGGRYSNPNSNANSSNVQADSRVGYEPYTNQPTSNTTNAYSAYNSYSQASTVPANISNPPQSMASSYNQTTQAGASQWSSNQPRNAQSYNTNNSASSNPAYNRPSVSSQGSSSLHSFNVRPQSTAPLTRSSSSTYNHQLQPQQTPYNSYSTPQQPSSSNQQNNWYGFPSNSASSTPYGPGSQTAANNAYGANGAGGSSYHQQHHRAMNLAGHTYGDGDAALYDLLRTNPEA